MRKVGDEANQRILILGEDTLGRDALCRVLRGLPLEIEIADVEELQRFHDAFEEGLFDLVFIAVMAPGAALDAEVHAVKAVAGRTPVAVLGVIDSWAAARGAIGAGAAGYVPIMSSTKVVLHAVELMLGGGVYLPASVLGTAGGLAPAAANGGGPAVRLTPRQHAVLTELAKGQSNKQIANALDLSEATVKVHIAAIMRTLKVENRTQAVLAASQAGILDQAAA